MKINVIDGIMGVGKTSFAIDKINGDTVNNYMYITPYLDECKRIRECCTGKNFSEPSDLRGSKSRHLKQLIKQNANIVSTHSLFRNMDNETRELLSVKDYILILDEVMDVVEKVNISEEDKELLMNNYLGVDSNNELKWVGEYHGEFEKYKKMCEAGTLILVDNIFIMWKFPAEVFRHFKEVYILTYMFESQTQKYYFDYYDLKYNFSSIDRINNEYKLVPRGKSLFEKEKIEQVRRLVEVCGGRYNNIGKQEFSLSKQWFKDHKNTLLLEELKRNLFNYFKNQCGTRGDYNGWTTFKDYKSYLSGKGYTKGFIPLNMRATNEFGDKSSMAYVVNRFQDPNIMKMFSQKDITIDQDRWGLSEMLQWVWRGCIRKDRPMKLYIPSSRMRGLFERWLENENAL